MEMLRVYSRAIMAVGYDPVTFKMKIQFVEGHTYDFCGVPKAIYEGLMKAASKGSYYNDFIRDRFRCF